MQTIQKTADEIRVENQLSKIKAINEEIATCEKYIEELSKIRVYTNVQFHNFILEEAGMVYNISHDLSDSLVRLMHDHFTDRKAALFVQASNMMK